MAEVGFRDLQESATDLRNKQAVRRPYYLSGAVAVPNGGNAKITFVCDKDADICVLGINGTVIAPATFNGFREDGATPMLWPLNPVTPIGGYAERGLFMRVYDGSKKGYQLSDPKEYMDVKEYLQPGYIPGAFSRPVPFRHYMKRDDKLIFEFINKDTSTSESRGRIYHFVTLNLTCRKYEPFTK